MPPYIIVANTSLQSLVDEVNKMCLEGYIPLGSIVRDDIHFIQSMYKEIKELKAQELSH